MPTPTLSPPPKLAGATLGNWLHQLWTSVSRVRLVVDGPTITTGTGVPASEQPDGSLYLRSDGGAGSTLYVREAGAWVAK